VVPVAEQWLTFLSDFGFEDAFLGVCKGVIARIAPQVRVLDVLHLVAAQDVAQGASVLASAIGYLPAPAVHLAVVDPFRASPVRGVAVRTGDGSTFVSPDNGLTSQAWAAAGGAREAVALDNDSLWLPKPARTFRGRDVFAPVAARLAAGLALAEVGNPVPLEQLEREVIRQALEDCGGNVSRTARYLSITRQTLMYRIKKGPGRHRRAALRGPIPGCPLRGDLRRGLAGSARGVRGLLPHHHPGGQPGQRSQVAAGGSRAADGDRPATRPGWRLTPALPGRASRWRG